MNHNLPKRKGGGVQMEKLRVGLILAGLFQLFTLPGFASEIDILVDKLVEKGILSREEAKEIVQETEKEVQKQARASEVPAGVRNLKLKGDFRLRYQWQDNSHKRERARIRFRIGAVTRPNDDFEIGFGLATGSSDPRSTNITLDNSFESKDIKLDYAYAEYFGITGLSIWGGKYKGINKAVWCVSDLLWDDDLRPEGVGIKFNYQPEYSNFSIFVNTGLWILDEKSSGADPLMAYIQPGIGCNITENISFKTALTYYATSAVKGHTLDHSSNTNTLLNGGLKYDYDVWAPSVELEFKNLMEFVPYVALFGDYVYNPDPNSSNKGYLVGLKFGNIKIKKFGNWQFKYMYRRLEKDAWLDVFPDSDAYGGKTDVKGHEAVFKFGLAKNLTLGLDYYYMEQIHGNGDEDLLQIDLVWKF